MAVEEVVQKKYRITIPAELRERLRIREGDKVRIILDDGRLVIEPQWLVDNPTEKLASIGSPKKVVTEPGELEEKIRRGRLRV